MRSDYNQLKFVPNGRNEGGRNQIQNHHRSHVLALINTGPSINTMKPPKSHVDEGRIKKNEGSKRFVVDEVAETYKRISNLKSGFTDNKEPVSFSLKSSLQRKHSVQKDVEETFHRNHVNSMMRKIVSIQTKSSKRIETILNQSKLHKQSQIQKEDDSRVMRSQWDTRCPHPLEAEWKVLRPHTVKLSDKIASTLDYKIAALTNLLSPESQLAPQSETEYEEIEDTIQKTSVGQALDYTDAFSSSQKVFKDKSDDPQQKKRVNYLLNTYQISDDKNQNCRNILIPLIPQQADNAQLHRTIKKILMQIIMDYKIFQRQMIFQIGTQLVQHNPWLDEDKIRETCNYISRNLYGFD